MSGKVGAVRQLIGNHGVGWLAARVAYEMQVRSGLPKRRFRQRAWDDAELARWLRPGVPADAETYAAFRRQHAPSFLFRPQDRSAYRGTLRQTLGEVGRAALLDEARQIRQGRFRYFSGPSGSSGFPPDWHSNPFTGQRTSPSEHWSRIPMYSVETGDLKYVWEPGRFASAYTLSRAYWMSDDEDHAETFWGLLESWAGANPPNHGAHWRCGQETSLRLMAWCFGLHAFGESPATTPDRLALFTGMVAAQAERIAGDHLYARLQRNNHSVSEGVGLWTVGLLFPELNEAEAWREAGRKILEREAKSQIYTDGAYIQHSTNYHRLMVHDFLWAIRIGERNGHELSTTLHDRVRRAVEFLYQLQDETDGRVPNYGANDGALILPVNGCGYEDYRPVVGAGHYLFHGTRLFESGPWDEDLIWLFGPDALSAEQVDVARQSVDAHVGGYYTLRGEDSWGMIRCASFRDRPSQADGLHLDIWRKGLNVACDAGTYSYYADPPWDNALVSTGVHNTVSVDGLDQMERGPRFLWLNWLRARLLHHTGSEQGSLEYFEGTHDGYERLADPIAHRRAVLRANPDTWIVVDDLLGEGEHEFRLHWLLADLPHEVDTEERRISLISDDRYALSLYVCLPVDPPSGGFEVVRGDETTSPRGWRSLYYGVRQPAVSVTLSLRGVPPCRLVSIFAPPQRYEDVSVSAQRIVLEGDGGSLRVNLARPDGSSIVRDACWGSDHGQQDQLRIAVPSQEQSN